MRKYGQPGNRAKQYALTFLPHSRKFTCLSLLGVSFLLGFASSFIHRSLLSVDLGGYLSIRLLFGFVRASMFRYFVRVSSTSLICNRCRYLQQLCGKWCHCIRYRENVGIRNQEDRRGFRYFVTRLTGRYIIEIHRI